MNEASETCQATAIRLVDLTVQAGEQKLLENVCAEFPAGKVTLIVGRSGAGKTVLLSLLAGLVQQADESLRVEGAVQFQRDGQRLTEVPVGVVFQHYAVFDELSPVENVRFAIAHRLGSRTDPKRAEQLLEELQVPPARRTAHLSGGQRQRLAIARTLAFDPDVVLYDEPTSGLDPATARQVAGMIAATHDVHRKTSVIVTHDYASLAPIAHRIYLLDGDQRRLVPITAEEMVELPERMASSTPQVSSTPGPPAEKASTTAADLAARFGRTAGRFLEATSRIAEEVLLVPYRLLPRWRSPLWGLRYALHFLRLVAGVSAWCYLAVAGAIIGFVTTYFTFRFLPYARYTEPLLIDDLLASMGFALYRILVPVLATILIAARCGAAVASDIGGKRYGQQMDALRTFGVDPPRYLLTGTLLALLIGAPLLVLISYAVASITSLVVFTATHPQYGPEFWQLHYHRELFRHGRPWPDGSGWLLAKVVLCALGIGSIAYRQGARPKQSTRDVSLSVTSTILWATLFVLLIHFIFAFFEFE